MKKIADWFKKADWGYLALAFILSAAGILLLFYPTDSLKTISYIIGISACLVGIFLAIHTLSKNNRGLGFALTMICAVLTIVCGLMQLIFPDRMFDIFSSFIALFLIIDASFKLQTVIWAKRLQHKFWWAKLPLCVLVIMGGFLSIKLHDLSVQNIAILLGLTLFFDGVLNLFAFFSPRYTPVPNKDSFAFKKGDLPSPCPEKSAPKRSRRAEKKAAKNPNMMPSGEDTTSSAAVPQDEALTEPAPQTPSQESESEPSATDGESL